MTSQGKYPMNNSLHFDPPVIGHRGACAYAPENTMASFLKAAQLKLKWIEFDVMDSSDGVPVIFHDDYLDRTTNGKGLVNQYSFAYLQTLDAGKYFDPAFSCERIPSLLTVIEFLQDAKMSANIEIKTLPGHEEKLIQRVMKEMQPYMKAGNQQYLFSSFFPDALYALRKYSPDCQIGVLLHAWLNGWKDVCHELNCVSVHVNEAIMTETHAREIKEMGKSLLCYTVNDPGRAKELFSWGVDAVFSDAPDLIARV